jgi:superfamily II DNA or RNA helicase
MQLRPYQVEAKEEVNLAFTKHRSTLVEMATGLGKTVLFATIADEWPGRVLVLAHRDELIRQAAEKIYTITGHSPCIEMGRERAGNELFGTKVCVASIQTLARANRRGRFHSDHFSLIVIDEGHHGTAVTYREVLDYFKSAKRLFVTATPKRADKVGMEAVCESVAFQYGIEPAIDDGYLVPIQQKVVKVDDLDFSKARTVADDFNQADLERILTEEGPMHAMCGSAYELIGTRQALWFCASVVHARQVAGILGRYAFHGGVEFLSGDTPKEERRAKVDSYKSGKIQHLVNCMLFLEGFDAPSTSVIVMCRPTKSLALYMQVLGRGTRPLPGIVDGIATKEARREAIAESLKPSMLVIDFAGNAGKHKIIQATDVLEGLYDPPTRKYAKETVKEEGREVSIQDALERAKLELALLDEEEERRKDIKANAVSYRSYDVSPFVKEYTTTIHPVVKGEPISHQFAGFIWHLSKEVGVEPDWDEISALDKRQARQLVSILQRKKHEHAGVA